MSTDTPIGNLLAALHPGHPDEQINHRLRRLVRAGLLPCQVVDDTCTGLAKDC